jgi:PBP1b-binding outer membrane lipoprotein LpoB
VNKNRCLVNVFVLGSVGLLVSSCTTVTTGAVNRPSERETRYVPTDTPTPKSGGTGIESQDIVSMTDRMVRDMLSSSALVDPAEPVVVVVDDAYFVNDSSQRLNKRLIVDRLRNELFRAAKGRIRFIARHADSMVRDEQALRDQGQVDGEPVMTLPTARYRLTGRFQNLEGGTTHGDRTNYVQILFEMVSLNTGELVWSGMYEFKKSSREAIMYQ